MTAPQGLSERRTKNGILVMRVHYSADPERDEGWVKRERPKYSSQSEWDKEQEIIHEAGGGEPLFLHILNQYWNKIVISDPTFQPSPWWQRLGGFDHGKTNPTALLETCIDQDGTIICLGEYYQPSKTPSEHCDFLREAWPQCFELPKILSDPSIFFKTQAQPKGGFKAISELYAEGGLGNLVSAPDNTEITGMERILEHWHDLEHREPTLKIVLLPGQDIGRPNHGLNKRGCPNLLWELKRARRAQSTATQLMKGNPTEQIVDKDNHLRDTLKYIVMSLPSPSSKPSSLRLREIYENSPDPTSAAINFQRAQAELDRQDEPVYFSSRTRQNSLSKRKYL